MRISMWTDQKRDVGRSNWEGANVPEGKWGASMDKMPDTKAVKVYRDSIQSYISALKENIEKGSGLILHGPYRSGKSSIGAIICGEVLSHRCSAYWLEAFELVDGWRFKDERYDGFRTAHIVVLDDMGMEAQSGGVDWPRALVRESLKFRLERLMPVIVTTNMRPDEIEKVYGGKIMALFDEFMLPVQVSGAEGHWRKR
jgi:DNA replication protein DnaC